MADVSIDAAIVDATARGMRSVVFTTASVGYWFFVDGDGDFSYVKTTDGGATWGVAVQIGPNDTDLSYDVWYDQWTPGDTTGTKIHMAWFGSTADDALYRSLDTNGDTLGTQTTVFVGATAVSGAGNCISITKARDGKLYCAFDLDAGAERGLHRSTDGGATWSADLDDTFVEDTRDRFLLFPASNTGDNADIWCVYQDASANGLTLKMWDSSAAAASESATIQTHIESVEGLPNESVGFSASIRHSDGHLILAAVSERDTATADHQVWDINGTGSITALTAITTDIDDHYYPAVFIDQNTNDIYVAFNGLRDGSETLTTSTKVYYTKSTDDGTTWSAGSTAYMENAAGAVFQVWAPLMGPRFYVGWKIGTTLLGNFNNSIELAPQILLNAAVTVSVTTAAGLTTAITMAGSAALSITTLGALTTEIRFVGAASLAITATADLTTAITMAGASTIAITATADLTAAGQGALLEAAVTLSVAAAGALTTAIQFAASVSCTAVAAAELTAGGIEAPARGAPWADPRLAKLLRRGRRRLPTYEEILESWTPPAREPAPELDEDWEGIVLALLDA